MKRNVYFRQILLIAAFLLLQTTVSAQLTVKTEVAKNRIKRPQIAIGRVLYNFSHMKDTTRRDYFYTEIFELDYAQSSSFYSSYTKKENDSMLNNEVAKAFKEAPDPDHIDLILTGKSSTPDQFFTERDSQEAVFELRYLAGTLFVIPSRHSAIHWQIIDSTKTIQGFLCQKATGESYGRYYTAWFCTDLPYRFGPRRLNGLPGLILEACDEKKEVLYSLNRIEDFNTAIAPFGISTDAATVTPESFGKAEEAFKRNPQAFIDAHQKKATAGPKPQNNLMDGFDASKIKSVTVKKNNSIPPGIIQNNPIDLQKD